MATNYRYGVNNQGRELLKVQDLTVGQELIRADWNYMTGQWRETIFTVKKVLKTRLVIEVKRADGFDVECRVLVTNDPTWASRHGEVQTRIEGQSEWDRNSYFLFTTDDPTLAELREDFKVREAARVAKIAAREALETFKRELSVENAEATIAALQNYIATQKEN